MTFIANEASVTYAAQSAPDSVDFDMLLGALQRLGVISGLAVTPSSAMTLSVAAGSTEYYGIRRTVSSGTVTIGTADATNARFDLVVVDNTGTKQVRAGTAASNPVFPTLSTGDVALAAVYIPAGTTTITSAMIADKRIFLFTPDGMAVYGDASDGVVNFDGTTARLGLTPSSGVYTLTRDIFLDDGSQLSGTATISTASWKIFCRGTLTVGSGCTIKNLANNGSGSAQGTAGAAQSLGSGAAGGAGGSGAAGSASVGPSNSIGATGGAGGASTGSGGTGGGTAAGGAVLSATLGAPRHLGTAMPMLGNNAGAFARYVGGGGGSGGSATTGSTGGGGGAGGNLVWIAARDLVNNGTISANGGNGGIGAIGTGTGAGGGGGGGGGAVVTITGSFSGNTPVALGGTGGAPAGTGNNGATGGTGNVYQIQN